MNEQTVTDVCGTDPGAICRLIYEWTSNAALAQISGVAGSFLKVLLIFLFAWIGVRFARRWVTKGIEAWLERREALSDQEKIEEEEGLGGAALRRARKLVAQRERSAQRARTLGTVVRSMVAATIYGLALLLALSEFGINLGPLIAGAGIVGVAIGFGSQTLVKDFLTGIFMLLEDQYGVGDVVDVGSTTGVVEEISLRTTQIRDINGTLWHIPNGEITRVANMTQDWARAVLDIEVAYDTNLDQAMVVIKQVADQMWQEQLENATILEEPVIAGVQNLGDNSIAIRLMAKVEPGEQFATGRELRRRIKIALDEAGIEIPFPQRTVWVHTADKEQPAVGEAEDFPEFAPKHIDEEG